MATQKYANRKVSIEIPKGPGEVDAGEAQEMAPAGDALDESTVAAAGAVGVLEDEQEDTTVECGSRALTPAGTAPQLPSVGAQQGPQSIVMLHPGRPSIIRTDGVAPVELRPVVPPYTFGTPKTVTQTANGITRGDF